MSLVVRRRLGALALAVVAVALVWLLLSGGSGEPEPEVRSDSPTAATTSTTDDSNVESGKSVEELVDSILLVGVEGTKLDPEALESLARNPPGGVLIGPGNWEGRRAGEALIDAVREAAGPETLIVTRQEGGPYRSLFDLPPEQREIEIGDRGDLRLAAEWAGETAKALRDVGVDLNLAPVADVATLDSPIADRAFSDDATVAAEMTAVTVRECERAELACAPSHFPGLGASTADTDQGPSSIALDGGTLRSRDVTPFVAAFDAGAPAVVVSHGLYAAFDPVTPATLVPEIATGLLRDELGFAGAAISDDISAGAVAAFAKPGPAAVSALEAGIDLIQVANPANVETVRRALVEAVEAGVLSEERLSEAAERVAELGD